jgi:hypothetical protein
MHDPGLPPDYTNLLARESVEDEPQPPDHPVALRAFAIFAVLCAIASVAYLVVAVA